MVSGFGGRIEDFWLHALGNYTVRAEVLSVVRKIKGSLWVLFSKGAILVGGSEKEISCRELRLRSRYPDRSQSPAAQKKS